MSLAQSRELSPGPRNEAGDRGEGAGQMAEVGAGGAASRDSPGLGTPRQGRSDAASRPGARSLAGLPAHLLDELIDFGTPALHLSDLAHAARGRHA